MVTRFLTDERIEDGKALLEKVDRSGLKVDSALWFFFDEQEVWKLVVSVNGIDRIGPKEAYGKIQKLLTKQPKPKALALDEVAIAKKNSPLLELMRSAIRTGPGINGIRFTGNVINGRSIPDAYIYRLQ